MSWTADGDDWKLGHFDVEWSESDSPISTPQLPRRRQLCVHLKHKAASDTLGTEGHRVSTKKLFSTPTHALALKQQLPHLPAQETHSYLQVVPTHGTKLSGQLLVTNPAEKLSERKVTMLINITELKDKGQLIATKYHNRVWKATITKTQHSSINRRQSILV